MKCKDCIYWIYCDIEDNDNDDEYSIGLCHRFPKREEKQAREWCGEFQPKETN